MSVETLPGEEWRPVVGFEGLYEVSSLGRVKSLRRRFVTQERLLSQPLKPSGHPHVGLSRPGQETYAIEVHRLMAAAFLGPKPTPKHETCHKDGNPENNHVDNLRWGTRSDNMLDRVRHGEHHCAKRDACSKGHKYPPNVRRTKKGARICPTCEQGYQKRWREQRKLRAA